MQVRQHDDIDVFLAEPGGTQRIEQYMLRFLHAVAFAQLRLEKRTDAGFEQHALAVQAIGQQRTASERNTVFGVGPDPFFPHAFGDVAEHGAAIEFLRIAEDGPQLHFGAPDFFAAV